MLSLITIASHMNNHAFWNAGLKTAKHLSFLSEGFQPHSWKVVLWKVHP